ncbi:MAG: DUF1648 domain-containing protein [Syntrophomonas sp.]
MWRKIDNYYPPWLELISVLLLVFAFAYTFSNYELLPESIPTHFGLSGHPDSWSPKGFWSIYMLPVIGTAICLSMAIMNFFLIIKPADPGKVVNLTKQQKEKLGPEQLESIRRFTAQGMIMINLTLAALFTVLQYELIKTALGLQQGLGISSHILVGALLIESIWLTVKTMSMTSTLKKRRR